jgi:hypothetical protein
MGRNMQIRITDKTSLSDIMISLKTFQHLKKRVFPSFPSPIGSNRHIQLLFVQKKFIETPPCFCWSHPSAYFQRAKIISSCYDQGWTSLFCNFFLIKILKKLLKIINKEFRANVVKGYTHPYWPS